MVDIFDCMYPLDCYVHLLHIIGRSLYRALLHFIVNPSGP